MLSADNPLCPFISIVALASVHRQPPYPVSAQHLVCLEKGCKHLLPSASRKCPKTSIFTRVDLSCHVTLETKSNQQFIEKIQEKKSYKREPLPLSHFPDSYLLLPISGFSFWTLQLSFLLVFPFESLLLVQHCAYGILQRKPGKRLDRSGMYGNIFLVQGLPLGNEQQGSCIKPFPMFKEILILPAYPDFTCSRDSIMTVVRMLEN